MELSTDVQVTQVVWTGPVTWRHLALLIENEKLMGILTKKLEGHGYSDCSFTQISAVTETIEDLIIALEVNAIKDGSQVQQTIHVKMEGYEISFH